MSCHKVTLMLSSYIDGELKAVDSEFVAAHLATCESCSRAYGLLCRTTNALADASEIEPPAFLLEKIEAATINRPTLRDRLTAGLRPIGWATAGLAAAIIFGSTFFQADRSTQQTGKQMTVQPKPSIEYRVDKPTDLKVAVTETTSEKTSVLSLAKERHAKAIRRARLHNNRTIAKKPTTPSKSTPKPVAKVTKPVEEIPAQTVAEVPEKLVTGEQSSTVDQSASTETKPAPEKIQIIAARTEALKIDDRLKGQAITVDEIRRKVSARYQHNMYDSVDRIEGKRYSVSVASVKF